MPESNEVERVGQQGPRFPWRWAVLALGIILVLPLVAYGGFVLYVMYGVEGPDQPTPSAAANSTPPTNASEKSPAAKSNLAANGETKTTASDPDAKARLAIIGTWERFDDGRRRLTIKPDGTAVLVYEPKGFNRIALATGKLTVQIDWTLKAGYVDFRSKSGDPEYGFKVAKLSEGARKRRRIVKLTGDKLTLTNDAKDRVSYWTRIE